MEGENIQEIVIVLRPPADVRLQSWRVIVNIYDFLITWNNCKVLTEDVLVLVSQTTRLAILAPPLLSASTLATQYGQFTTGTWAHPVHHLYLI